MQFHPNLLPDQSAYYQLIKPLFFSALIMFAVMLDPLTFIMCGGYLHFSAPFM
jgi:hypothetical protein